MIIIYEKFIEKYKPITNHIDDNAPFDGYMYETFGDELSFVREQKYDTIWTITEGDDNTMWLCAGFHIVNRMGYMITETPWEDEFIDINLDD